MPHIHTEPGQYDQTITMFIVRTDGDQPRLYLHQHRSLNMLLPFGGHVELTENPWQAVDHELLEESGYTLSQLQILQPAYTVLHTNIEDDVFVHPVPVFSNSHNITDQHRHSDNSYLFVTGQAPAHSIDAGESADIRLLNLQEIQSLDDNVIRPNVRSIAIFALTDGLDFWIASPATDFKL